ncbi:MAG: UrcA family protein [Novosphingobium sp.]
MQRLTLIAAAAAAALMGTTAHAGAKAVRTSDLDLSTPAGQAELDSRIARAARAVCSSQTTGTRLRSVDQDCVRKAAAATRAELAAGEGARSGG